MRSQRLRTAVAVGVAIIAIRAETRPAAAPSPTDDGAIVHVLNRVGFGPRPGEVASVRETGLQRYIDQQLHPERIADAGMSARLESLATLGMSEEEIVSRFEIPQMQA